MLKKYLKILACGLLLGACFSSATSAQPIPNPQAQNQTIQIPSSEGVEIYRGIYQGSPLLTLKTNNTVINIVTLPNGDTIVRVPDGQYALKPEHGMPYCINGCDIPEDCNGGKRELHDGNQWTCNNAKGFCRGVCVQENTRKPGNNNLQQGR